MNVKQKRWSARPFAAYADVILEELKTAPAISAVTAVVTNSEDLAYIVMVSRRRVFH